ncbi:F14J8.16 PROTEIN [Salix purpurea]|uniref:F14J8.16 PROTEIN n=1 Tax=Salix purpurea TaxID=77065 RepID=A0A9Q0PC45_SALPP|nr:F14J8.16 PROTEIN [Salix purpurea]
MTGSIKRKMVEVVPVVVKSEGFDFMHDERLDRRLKRRNIGTRRFKFDSNGKNKNCKGIAALKGSSEILCIQKDGHDRDVGNEDCRKYYDGSVRGLFIDSDAHLDTKSSSSKKNNAKYSGVKYNTSRSRSCILLDDDCYSYEVGEHCKKVSSRSCILLDDDCYSYEVDEHCKKVSKDLDGGLYVDSDCDAYSDKTSSKRNIRSTDNGKVNVDLVNGFVENSVGTNGALDDGNNKYDGFVGDGADTNDDPDYKMFLDKFRQDGKSCILEIPLTNEISITVRYHSQDGTYDGCDMEKPDTEKDCPKTQNKGTTKLLKIDSRIERMETMSDTRKERVVASRKLRGVTARAIEISEAESKKKTEYMNPISCRGDGHAGKRPSSEALCPTNCKSKPEMKLDMTQRILRDVPARVRKFSAVERNLNVETVDLTSSRANEGVSKRHSPETLSLTNFECKHKVKMEMVNHITENQIKSRAAPSRERKISAVKSKCKLMHLDMENCRRETLQNIKDVPAKERGNLAVVRKFEKQSSNAVPNRADGHASKKPRSQAPSSTNCKCECKMNLDMVDHSYQIFLNSLKKDGRYAVFAPQSGKGVLFGEEEHGSSDSEVIVMDKDQFFDGKDTPFVSAKAYIVEDEGWMDNRVSSKFREELLKILEKPYDEREFEDLWQRISHRSHVNRDINLRSGCIRFKTTAIGKSYLDHHADLEAKIQSAQSNQPEILNLMRGFFYWLMNASHAGSRALRPWLDSSCLKVRPRHQN